MPAWNRLAKALSVVLPAGAFGASVVLALATADANPQPPTGEGVSTRLQQIRSGVSSLTGSATFGPEGDAKATPTWWGNGGWGRWHPGWGNGGFGWRNGGWGNGWHNGGWGNGGWPNWHNAGAWGNGAPWANFWHNW